MQASTSRFKSLAVTAGLSFWCFILTSSAGLFSLEYFIIFVAVTLSVTQIFTKKISKFLDIVAIFNTKIFLGFLFIFVIAIYGIFFKILQIDLLRVKNTSNSYWLDIESNDVRKMF